MTAELVSVTRSDGDTITIKFKYSNTGQKDVELAQALTNYSPNNLATMVYYVDGKNKKKYSVIKDSSGEFLSSGMKGITSSPASRSPVGLNCPRLRPALRPLPFICRERLPSKRKDRILSQARIA